ncbi:glycosyltransferase family 1 protein [Hydnum rufescens UP504]|uniref:Glycosyltransferase family 1 protein n=1 Tax=Hydnum rufescens UP504 TaxID=1448309 RepID=A0A9P6B197_9AGAM|nr:glycosyltransferase family 1 protein [Hydnum rufescens UP504]
MLAFAAAPASWCLRRATSDAVGRYKQLSESPDARGKSRDQLLEDAFTYTEGKLIHLAGTAPMYDYEFQPQLGSVPFNPSLAYGVITAGAQHKNWSGLVNTTSPDLELGAIEAFADATGGICLQVGPQFSESAWDGRLDDPNVSLNEEDQAVLSFLDSCEKRFGINSAIYVSFGTVYSPSRRPDLLLTLIDSLLSAEPPLPFVFATVTTYHLISEATRTKVIESGLGIITRFAPQQMVLQHPATGWFMTHTGSGGMYESIISKVPMVCWPCMTDQPISAANLSVNWRVAFELIQVRTGPSVGQPTYRGPTVVGSTEAIENEMREVWAAMRGEEGAERTD